MTFINKQANFASSCKPLQANILVTMHNVAYWRDGEAGKRYARKNVRMELLYLHFIRSQWG